MQMLLKTGLVVLALAVSVVASHAAPEQPAQPAGLYDEATGTNEFWDQFGD